MTGSPSADLDLLEFAVEILSHDAELTELAVAVLVDEAEVLGEVVVDGLVVFFVAGGGEVDDGGQEGVVVGWGKGGERVEKVGGIPQVIIFIHLQIQYTPYPNNNNIIPICVYNFINKLSSDYGFSCHQVRHQQLRQL